jgi:Rnl2 family RNA ligase
MERIFNEGYDKQEFVVQEKVHGSNVCFITDGQTVGFGKRTGFVEAGEKFYDYETFVERYNPKIIALYTIVKEKHPDIKTITVYGEMFGGRYPHRDVKNNAQIPMIQKGVFYCPTHEFYAFDLYVTTGESARYLPVDEMNGFFEQGHLFYARTVFKGTLNECLQHPNDFQSLISTWLGLPPLENNVCEGVIIRPVEPMWLRNGSRVLLKNKNARFAEKKAIKKREPKLFVESTYSEILNALLPVAEQYVTENRLNNVISHIGQITLPNEIGKLIGLFSKDILTDFLKEHSGEYSAIEKSEQKILNRHINTSATNLIKKVYNS